MKRMLMEREGQEDRKKVRDVTKNDMKKCVGK